MTVHFLPEFRIFQAESQMFLGGSIINVSLARRQPHGLRIANPRYSRLPAGGTLTGAVSKCDAGAGASGVIFNLTGQKNIIDYISWPGSPAPTASGRPADL
jgi:hypothetical protein